MLAIKVTKPNMGGYILKPSEIKQVLDEIDAMLDYGVSEDSIQITVIEISEEEIDSLPEFAGW